MPSDVWAPSSVLQIKGSWDWARCRPLPAHAAKGPRAHISPTPMLRNLLPFGGDSTAAAPAASLLNPGLLGITALPGGVQLPTLPQVGGLAWLAPNPKPTVWDRVLMFVSRALIAFFSIVRKIIPPPVLVFLIPCVPMFIGFYELTLRRFIPQLPSSLTIIFKLFQQGILTIDSINWLVSSLPQAMVGGLSALSGAAMSGTVAVANGTALATAGIAAVGKEASALAGGVSVIANGAAKSAVESISVLQNGATLAAKNTIQDLPLGKGAAAVDPAVLAKSAAEAVVSSTNAIADAALHNPIANATLQNPITNATLHTATDAAAALQASTTALTSGLANFGSLNPLTKRKV
ncbi:hypothetical protein BC834DRAFT_54701 [Gloeopeniophorella convolvens]|nr:hypothetical protein BC834DRAFT_54701 [Gloeopeniophorella convolvens]